MNYNFYKEGKMSVIEEVVSGKIVPVTENLIYKGHKRYYIEDLTQRDYYLQNTTPYQFMIDNKVIESGSWVNMLKEIVTYLIEKYPKTEQELFDFRCDWTKAEIFTPTIKTNYKQINDRLFINTNHTALHSCWLIQDLIKFFGIDINRVHLLIHKSPCAESENIRNEIEREFIKGFKDYIVNDLGKSTKFADRVVYYTLTILNKILKAISPSYINFFLFDNRQILFNYSKIVKNKIDNGIYTDEEKRRLNICFKLINDYYKKEKY